MEFVSFVIVISKFWCICMYLCVFYRTNSCMRVMLKLRDVTKWSEYIKRVKKPWELSGILTLPRCLRLCHHLSMMVMTSKLSVQQGQYVHSFVFSYARFGVCFCYSVSLIFIFGRPSSRPPHPSGRPTMPSRPTSVPPAQPARPAPAENPALPK